MLWCHLGRGLQRSSSFLKPRTCTVILKNDRFWEPNPKSGYNTGEFRPVREHVKEGLKELKPEVLKWKDEWIRNIRCEKVDQFFEAVHNDYEIVWKFNNKESIDEWTVTCDTDHGEGKSAAEFVHGPDNTGLFTGRLCTDVAEDGVIKKAGYVNICSPKNMISFKRIRPFEWYRYTHLLVRTRGDGRPYQIILGMDRYFDVNWNDVYTYPLYTRGGPYWQISKIPFNKFLLGGKGRVQDKQQLVQLDKVTSLGITLADGYTGPFKLEIDWVGVIYDETHNPQFEYEMYDQGYMLSD